MAIIHSLKYTLPFLFVVPLVVTRCHSLSFVVTRCHSLYHSLSFVVTRCHSLSLFVTRCTTRLSFYKRSYWDLEKFKRAILENNIHVCPQTATDELDMFYKKKLFLKIDPIYKVFFCETR